MRSLLLVLAAATLTALVCTLLVADRLPLGVAEQWTWSRFDQPTPLIDWFGAGLFGVLYVVFVWRGAQWVGSEAWTRRLALAGLVAAAFAVQMEFQVLGFGLGKWPFVLFSPSSSGYFTAAKRDVRSYREYLANYEQIQWSYRKEFGPLHLATHPPGLVLVHYAALRLCDANPAITRMILATEPQSVVDAFREVARGAGSSPADEAAIWLIAILSQLASSLTVLPIFQLARRVSAVAGAWFGSAFWPLVPAVTIFMPKSDVVYPLFAAGCIACVVSGSTTPRRILAGLAAGAFLWVGMSLSFGMVAIAPFAVIAAVVVDWNSRTIAVRSAAPRLAGLIGAMALLSILLWIATDHALPATWWRCYRIHGTFYDPGELGAKRTYWPWVAVNIPEFVIATGLPLIVAALAGTACLVRARAAELVDANTLGPAVGPVGPVGEPRGGMAALGLAGGWWLTLLALDVAGKNLGEIARLWMFLMPFACVAAAPVLDRMSARRWPVLLLIALEAIQTAIFAAHVQGFFDANSLPMATPSRS
jgi:hypothetical protein